MNFLLSEHLFTHRYDIDDIIAALCASTPQYLETETGTLSPTKPATKPSHTFLIEPLPAGFITELQNHPEKNHLTEDDLAILTHLLATATVQSLPMHFAQNRVGGWLRERVKDAALEWLDTNDLIPPSMRHINRAKAAKLFASRTVQIEDFDD